MKKYLLTIAALGMALFSANAWDETGYYYPEQEPDDIWTEWEHYGVCDLEWSGMNAGYFDYDMEVLKRVSKDPNNHKFQWAFTKYFAAGHDLIVEYDPDTKKFRVPVMRKGVNNYWDNEPFLNCGWTEFYGTDDPYSSWDEVNGELRLFIMNYYPNQDLGDGTFGNREYISGVDIFRFHGFTKYDVDIDIDECVNTLTPTVGLNITSHPKNVSWELVNEYVNKYDTDIIAAIAERKTNALTASSQVQLELKKGPNSLVAISYNDKNEMVVSIKNIYCMPEEADAWKQIGKGRFTDDAVTGLSEEGTPVSVDVDVYENIATPGLYRVSNPYAPVAALLNGLDAIHSEHSHYLYFDASKPAQVVMSAMPLAITHPAQLGDMYITSKAYEQKRVGKLLPEYMQHCGKLNEGVITFPVSSIGIRLPDYTKVLNEDLIYWVNNNGEFKLQLPESGVAEIGIDMNEPVEYYSLQGLRIAAPADGQMVIARQGEKAVKMIFRK